MTAGEGARASRDRERSSLRPGDLERPLDRPSSTLRDIAQKAVTSLAASGLTFWQLFMKAFRSTFAELTEPLRRVFSSTRGILTRYAKTRLGRGVQLEASLALHLIPQYYSIDCCDRCGSLAYFFNHGLLSHLEHSRRSRGTNPQLRLSQGRSPHPFSLTRR